VTLSAGCGKKKIASGIEGENYAAGETGQQGLGTEEELNARRQGMIDEDSLTDQNAAGQGGVLTPEQAAMERFVNELVYFEYDSAALSPEAQETLRGKARWMRDNPGARVIIEGHTDSRGTGEYNLALGDRRATATRNFLTGSGIEGSRINIISYGEERPVDPMEHEAAWAKNRRAEFVIER
jgi:peptidoglycan-associated lipoprotein